MQLGNVILHVPKAAEASEFYECTFGLARRSVHDSGQCAEVETGGTALAFASVALAQANGLPPHPQGPDAVPFSAEIALVTGDLATAFRRALHMGAPFVAKPVARAWAQVVGCLRDLNGFPVELCTPIGGG